MKPLLIVDWGNIANVEKERLKFLKQYEVYIVSNRNIFCWLFLYVKMVICFGIRPKRIFCIGGFKWKKFDCIRRKISIDNYDGVPIFYCLHSLSPLLDKDYNLTYCDLAGLEYLIKEWENDFDERS